MSQSPSPLPYGRQSISAADIEAVVAVLQSDWLTQGPAVPAFEDAVSRYCGGGYAVAVNSATSALHIACLALGVGPGDLVWTSPNTFVASANCALYCGATVDFVDIDPATLNMCHHRLRDKLEQAQLLGRLPKVVIPIHFAGQSCDMAEIQALARTYGFKVIEDASHAIGGRYLGRAVGCGHYSDITVFSFHPVKVITSAEGGMAMTQDAELARRMRLLRSHGITRDAAEFFHACDGAWHYEQQMLGYNYRLNDLQAALGLSQLARLDAFVERRNALARRYDQLLADLPLVRPTVDVRNLSSFHMYVVSVKEALGASGRRKIFENLRQQGIGVNLHYQPVHLQPFYRQMGFGPGDFPNAETHARLALTLPLYPDMQDGDVRRVCAALAAILPSVAAEVSPKALAPALR